MTRRASSRAALGLALAAALTTSACATMSPVQTDMPYQASDGVSLNLGEGLDVHGLVVVGGEEKDKPGRLSGQLLNTSADAASVTFGAGGGSQVTTSVPAHSSVNLADEELTFDAIPAGAGDLLPMSITTQGTGANQLDVPVVPAEGYYKDLAPKD